MALPRQESPGYFNTGRSNIGFAGVGYFNMTDLFGSSAATLILAGATLTSVDLVVPGLNAFMLITIIAGAGGTTTFAYNIIDPEVAGSVIATRTIAAAVAPSASLIQSFGAFGVTTPAALGDVFFTIQLALTANVANQTIAAGACRLFCGTR